jgi:hypothetical protein
MVENPEERSSAAKRYSSDFWKEIRPSTSGFQPPSTRNSQTSNPELIYAVLSSSYQEQSFEYKTLQHHDELRILVILPGEFSQDIYCELKHVPMSQNPKYEALSYAWGGSSKSCQVYCDGSRVRITENLFSALRRLRFKDNNRCIWVDAICINQDDIPERNNQVSLMHRIYSEAVRAIVWLVEDKDSEASTAFNLLKSIAWCPDPLKLYHCWGNSIDGYDPSSLDMYRECPLADAGDCLFHNIGCLLPTAAIAGGGMEPSECYNEERRIHDMRPMGFEGSHKSNTGTRRKALIGWFKDIKPENILEFHSVRIM